MRYVSRDPLSALAAVAAPPAAVAVATGREQQPAAAGGPERREPWNAMFGAPINAYRASLGLPPADEVGGHVFTDRPWLAADPTLGPWQQPADLDVVQTGAWILPDERPLAAELQAFLDAGTPPGSTSASTTVHPAPTRTASPGRASRRSARTAIAYSSPAGGRTWSCSMTATTAVPSARSTSRLCSPGSGRCCASRRGGHDDHGRWSRAPHRWWCPDRGPALLGEPCG